MDPLITSQIVGTAAQEVNSLIGMISQRKRERRAMANQRELMDLQMKNQMELNKQGQQLQLDTWKQTNYPEQIKMLKEAGMNPSLLYGKGGAGGVTGSQGGGSAAGGSAPAIQPYLGIDALSAAKLGAEIELLKAQAEKARTEAGFTGGVATQEALTRIKEAGYRMENLEATTANTKAQQAYSEAATEYQKLQNDYMSKSMDELINGIVLNNKKLAQEIRLATTEANVAAETQEAQIKQIQQATVEQGLRMALIKENIIKTGEETEQVKAEVRKWGTEIVQRWTSLSQEQQQIEIARQLQKFNTNLPSKIGQWTGIIGNLLSGARGISLPEKITVYK